MRPELPDQVHQRSGRHLQRLQGEAAVRQRGQRVTLGQAGVDEAEPRVPDPQRRGGLGHLLPAELGDVAGQLRVVLQSRVQDVAPLAAGAADHQHLDALVDVAGQGGRALAGLVVRVGVD